MSNLFRISYFVDSTIEYKNSGFELVPDTRHECFDVKGIPVQIYYKRQKFPEILVTVGSVTKTLRELNKLWGIDNFWIISNEQGKSLLSITGEFWSNESANNFINICAEFIRKTFHIGE